MNSKAIILKISPELTVEQFEALICHVSADKQERIRRYRAFRDARNCLLGDLMVRAEICRMTGIGNNSLVFSQNEHSKPFLVNNPDIHFNISHSGQYIAAAFDSEPVGIDIEQIRPAKLKIAGRFFTKDETSYIAGARQGDSDKRFFEVWTKKESFLKREGTGLGKSLQSFSVLDLHRHDDITYHNVFSNDDAVCHMCTAKQESPYVKIIDTVTLLEEISALH